MARLGLICALLMLLGGCSYRLAHFAVLSPHTGLPGAHARGPQVGGESCAWMLLIPLGLPNLQDAVNDALSKAGPQYDTLVDSSVYYDKQGLWRIGRRCFRVVGTPVDTRISTHRLPPH